MRRGAKPAKAKAEAKPPVARKSLKSADSRVRDLEKRLAESLEREKATSCALTSALDQQTATSEILHVIGSSPTDVQPVFERIAQRAKRLCDARECAVFGFDGALIHLTALADTTAEWAQALRSAFPRPPGRGSMTARAIMTRSVVHVPDVLADSEYELTEAARTSSIRSVLSVPMLRNGEVIGAITVDRYQPEPFSDNQIALLQTFADQAVIAIENVRLFTELEARNADLTEALERQTATAEILRVISSSPTNVQPVFDTIARSASRLCGGMYSIVTRLDGELLHLVGLHNPRPGASGPTAFYPRRLSRDVSVARAILDRAVVHIPDVEQDLEFPREIARGIGARSFLAVPMLHENRPIGAIGVSRSEAGPFPSDQIDLLKVFADQAVIALENVRLFKELEASNRDLTSALDTQTATSDILRVISQSQTDVQPVFDAIVASAVRLLGAYTGVLTLFEGDQIVLATLTSTDDTGDIALRAAFPMSLHSEGGHAQVVRDRVPLNVADAPTDTRLAEATRARARARGYRSAIVVPLLRHAEVVGAISLTRREPGGFTDDEIALLKTFADQAVIAIENVRLFTELQARNRDLTATSQILQVISRSPTDVQPVFEAIADSAMHLFGAVGVAVVRYDGELISVAAARGGAPGSATVATERFGAPHRPIAGFPPEQTVVTKTMHHVADVDADPSCSDEFRHHARVRGFRSVLSMPMLRGSDPVGVIVVGRAQLGAFSTAEVELLRTFADQAVIAIENVRLFHETKEALEQQMVTSEILRVIASSPTDLQPVMDAVTASAARLCGAYDAGIFLRKGEGLELVAHHGLLAASIGLLIPLVRGTTTGRSVLERQTIHVADVQAEAEEFPEGSVLGKEWGHRTILNVPLLREGVAIGAIQLRRAEVNPFNDTQVKLLQTFADQAVIAIQNVRLFKELEARTGELTQSVEQLTALGEVSRAVSSTLDVETVLDTIVSRATQLAGADGCAISEYDDATELFHVRATHGIDAALVDTLRTTPLRKGEGVGGRATEMREPIQIADIAVPGAYQSHLRDVLIGAGFRAVLSVPLLREEQVMGSLSLSRKAPGEFSPEVVEVLKTFATQSALAIQNARLFREIADKSAQLEAASRHKSEFLANMSHELRTPLNAIIGFSEILAEKMFGDINEKQTEYLQDILESGRHLLSLINDILDLSKIEAGRMELEVTEFNLPNALDNALILVRERASRRGITLGHSVDERLGHIRGDERKVKQVLLNLLSNALKFTPEGGRIDVSAAVNNGVAEIAVADTGVGIAPEDQEAVFEEFRQVGTADKKVEGTGLGLALSRKFIELHGGRIWVKSQVGHGSTFTFTLPVRRED